MREYVALTKVKAPKIGILAFSDLTRDARVQRQIQTLKLLGNIITFSPVATEIEDVTGITIDTVRTPLSKARFSLNVLQRNYEKGYWSQPDVQALFSKLQHHSFNLLIANDLDTLPLTIKLAQRMGAKVLFDAHEYAPLEFDNRWHWKFLHQPYRDFLCHHYLKKADAMITVGQGIAKTYQDKYGVQPYVILNAPPYQAIPYRSVSNSGPIRLIHHGGASPERQLETMIKMVPYLDQRFELHFMLLGNSGYVKWLQQLAQSIAPDRVYFHDPVPVAQICQALQHFDMGLYLLPPTNFSYRYCLPNKFFDFIMAGLGVAIGPSVEMKQLIEEYQCGIVSSDFQPQNLATQLNSLSVQTINTYRQAALQAAKSLNANVEGQKLQHIVRSLLD